MLADRELETLLETVRFCCDVSKLVQTVLSRVVCCPMCKELFKLREKLEDHLRHCHADRLASSGLRQITDHCVQEGSDTISICPHCGFAVGSGPKIYEPNATTTILEHLKHCPDNVRAKAGPPDLSQLVSHDPQLINDYLHNVAEIELFTCPQSQCNVSSGSIEHLVRHLASDHSSAGAEDLTEEQLRRIRLAAQTFLDKRVTAESITAEVPADAPQVELAKSPTQRAEASPAPIPSARQDRVPRRTANDDSAAFVGKEFTRTVGEPEIDGGYVVLPQRLSSCIGRAEQVKVHLTGGEDATVLSFDPSRRCLMHLGDWFRKNVIESGDMIKFCLLCVNPPEIRMWTEWQKHLNYVLRCPAEDFEWDRLPIRDCLIRVFAEQVGPIHYRSLYSQISKHREVAVGSVIGTLSRHRGVLFAHTGRGMWSREKDESRAEDARPPSRGSRKGLPPAEVSDAVWNIVIEIEERDVVYRLLKRSHEPLSFVQICQKIAESRRIDWHELRQTGFLNAEDARLLRLDNGHFALRDWCDDPVPPPTPPRCESDDVHEKEPEVHETERPVPTSDNSADPPPPAAVPRGLLSKLWLVICKTLGLIVRCARRRGHG